MQNGKDSAVKAGFRPSAAEDTAARLLLRKDVLSYVARLEEKKAGEKLMASIVSGLNRLAFASSADSLKLALFDREFLLEHVDELDLFHIAEIKIPKEGSIEIKFFDRFKAFDKLLDIARFSESNNDAAEFFTALERSAKENGEDLHDDEI